MAKNVTATIKGYKDISSYIGKIEQDETKADTYRGSEPGTGLGGQADLADGE
jgi:hypothetical protein